MEGIHYAWGDQRLYVDAPGNQGFVQDQFRSSDSHRNKLGSGIRGSNLIIWPSQSSRYLTSTVLDEHSFKEWLLEVRYSR
jgi:hypothetical protein